MISRLCQDGFNNKVYSHLLAFVSHFLVLKKKKKDLTFFPWTEEIQQTLSVFANLQYSCSCNLLIYLMWTEYKGCIHQLPRIVTMRNSRWVGLEKEGLYLFCSLTYNHLFTSSVNSLDHENSQVFIHTTYWRGLFS